MTSTHLRLDHTFFENEVRPHLGSVLLQAKLLRPEQLDRALDAQRGSGKRLGQVLIDLGLLYEQDIARAIALQHRLQYIDLESLSLDPAAAARLDPELGKELCAIPVRFADGQLLVAIGDPEAAPKSRLERATGYAVQLLVCESSVILNLWRRLLAGYR